MAATLTRSKCLLDLKASMSHISLISNASMSNVTVNFDGELC